MRGHHLRRRMSSCALFLSASLLLISAAAAGLQEDASDPSRPGQAPATGLYVQVRLAKPMKPSALKPGDIVTGTLTRDVYAGERDLFPAGSAIRLVVDRLEKRKKQADDHWPGIVTLFAARHETYPAFRSATVSLPGGDVQIGVSLMSITHPVEIQATARRKRGKTSSMPAGPTLILEATAPESLLASRAPDPRTETVSATPVTLAAGMQAQIVLIVPLSASKSRTGDLFQARLIEPLRSGSAIVLPAGSLFEGKVVRSKPPRRLSRPGSLYLTFTELTLPRGERVPVAAHISGAETDRRSHLRLGEEGELSGGRPGKAWMLINLGVTAGITKETDDAFQIAFEALVSTATDASTAGTARIVAACASGIYMVTRHGRDVVLPKFTELDITFSRPVFVAAGAERPVQSAQVAETLQAGLDR